MTFDEVMKKFSGQWEDGKAVIKDQGGYYWTIATGNPDNFSLTRDGQRYVTVAQPEVTADEKPRRGRRLSAMVLSADE